MRDAPRHPLRDALSPADAAAPLDWLRATVVAVRTDVEPYTLTVQFADGSRSGWLTYAAWYAPRVGEVVNVLGKGAALWVLGADAPANVVTRATALPPLPPAPAAAPVTVTRTVPVTPTAVGTWTPAGWQADAVSQGASAAPEAAIAGRWYYGTGIADARGSGVIVAASMYVRRLETVHGSSGASPLRIGVHYAATRPAIEARGDLTVIETRAELERGRDALVHLSEAQIAALNAGAAGLGLDAGAGDVRIDAAAPSGQLALTITG